MSDQADFERLVKAQTACRDQAECAVAEYNLTKNLPPTAPAVERVKNVVLAFNTAAHPLSAQEYEDMAKEFQESLAQLKSVRTKIDEMNETQLALVETFNKVLFAPANSPFVAALRQALENVRVKLVETEEEADERISEMKHATNEAEAVVESLSELYAGLRELVAQYNQGVENKTPLPIMLQFRKYVEKHQTSPPGTREAVQESLSEVRDFLAKFDMQKRVLAEAEQTLEKARVARKKASQGPSKKLPSLPPKPQEEELTKREASEDAVLAETPVETIFETSKAEDTAVETTEMVVTTETVVPTQEETAEKTSSVEETTEMEATATTVESTIGQTVATPVEQTVATPVEQTVATPVEQTVATPVEQTVEKTVQKSALTAPTVAAEKSAGTPSEAKLTEEVSTEEKFKAMYGSSSTGSAAAGDYGGSEFIDFGAQYVPLFEDDERQAARQRTGLVAARQQQVDLSKMSQEERKRYLAEQRDQEAALASGKRFAWQQDKSGEDDGAIAQESLVKPSKLIAMFEVRKPIQFVPQALRS
ncbi:MAG: hypothetical protein MHM6MM_005105 [Cercozoa sp. M6MM]